MANAQEEGTIKGMTTDDLVIHAVQKRKELEGAMLDIQQENTAANEQMQDMAGQMQELRGELEAMKGAEKPFRETEKHEA